MEYSVPIYKKKKKKTTKFKGGVDFSLLFSVHPNIYLPAVKNRAVTKRRTVYIRINIISYIRISKESPAKKRSISISTLYFHSYFILLICLYINILFPGRESHNAYISRQNLPASRNFIVQHRRTDRRNIQNESF